MEYRYNIRWRSIWLWIWTKLGMKILFTKKDNMVVVDKIITDAAHDIGLAVDCDGRGVVFKQRENFITAHNVIAKLFNLLTKSRLGAMNIHLMLSMLVLLCLQLAQLFLGLVLKHGILTARQLCCDIAKLIELCEVFLLSPFWTALPLFLLHNDSRTY